MLQPVQNFPHLQLFFINLYVILNNLHISPWVHSCRWQRTAVQTDDLFWGKLVLRINVVSVCTWRFIFRLGGVRGHASKVWFTVGLTGLAVIDSGCDDQALELLQRANRWWPLANQNCAGSRQPQGSKKSFNSRAEPQSWRRFVTSSRQG